MCLPILARLWIPGHQDRTPLLLARELLDLATGHLGGRRVHLVGDAAYIGKPLRGLPAHVTVTARLRADAALYQPAPPPTGRPGRPRVKGDRLPELIVLAAMTRYQWTAVQVRCYGTTLDREVLAIGCLWYGALGGQSVQVILSRPVGAPDGYQLALVTTDLAATPAQVIERYSHRWSQEQAFTGLEINQLIQIGTVRLLPAPVGLRIIDGLPGSGIRPAVSRRTLSRPRPPHRPSSIGCRAGCAARDPHGTGLDRCPGALRTAAASQRHGAVVHPAGRTQLAPNGRPGRRPLPAQRPNLASRDR